MTQQNINKILHTDDKQTTDSTIKIKNIPPKTPENETDCLHTKNLFLTPSSHTIILIVLC